MSHQERWAACLTVTKRLLKTYPRDVHATGVTGSVGRGSDMRFSDIDFQVLVGQNSKLRSHRFVLNGSLFSVATRTEKDWVDELTQPNHALPLVVGSLKSMRAILDPSHHFASSKRDRRPCPARFGGMLFARVLRRLSRTLEESETHTL